MIFLNNLTVKEKISFEDFEKIDIRVGKIVKIEDFPEAYKKSYKLWIDIGEEIGVKTSSAQIVKNQTKEELLGKQVACVVNFEPKKVGPFLSEVLTLGPDDGTDEESNWIVLTTFKEAPLGTRIK